MPTPRKQHNPQTSKQPPVPPVGFVRDSGINIKSDRTFRSIGSVATPPNGIMASPGAHWVTSVHNFGTMQIADYATHSRRPQGVCHPATPSGVFGDTQHLSPVLVEIGHVMRAMGLRTDYKEDITVQEIKAKMHEHWQPDKPTQPIDIPAEAASLFRVGSQYNTSSNVNPSMHSLRQRHAWTNLRLAPSPRRSRGQYDLFLGRGRCCSYASSSPCAS